MGLWQVDYNASCDQPVLPPEFFTYQQFHTDGQKFFDADGNVVFEDMGTLHGTRLSVDQFANDLNATATK